MSEDERTGLRARLRAWMDHPLAGGPSWAYALGTCFAYLFLLEAATGVALMTSYVPSIEAAWASVYFTSYVMPHGGLVRGMHHFAGEGMLALAAAHVAALAVGGGHRRPRHLGFVATVLGVGLVAAQCITGGLLPWDQKGYWARRVELGIATMGPGGAGVARMVQGGDGLGQLALTRFYALHVVVLPLVLWLLWRFARGQARDRGGAAGVARRYFPDQALRDLGLLVLALVLVLVLAAHGAPLDAPADPFGDYPARPEWHLMWLYELRHLMPGALEFWGTAVVPLLLLGLLAALPWVDRKREGRSIAGIAAVVVAALLVGSLTYAAMRHDAHDARFQAQVARATRRADVAKRLAAGGVPVQGPLYMLAHDPELRGESLFKEHCASCHVLGELGDAKKANAPKLDGWGTEAWVLGMLHDPDADERFGKTPYRGDMPSMDVPPSDPDERARFKPMSTQDMTAAAAFLTSQGDEPGEPIDPRAARRDAGVVAAGKAIVRDRCTGCHLYGGEGDDEGSGTAPELAGYGSVAWTRAQVADPSTKTTYRAVALDPKRKHHMPRFADDLSPGDVDLVARWTRAHARGVPLR